MKILVADDSRTQALRLRADLEAQGFEVVIAYNGRQALEAAERESPDVILSDVLMPDIDGFRLCRALGSAAHLRGIPVVLRSAAFLDEEDRNLALAVGASDYVEKEVEGHELARILRDAVEKEGPTRSPITGLEEANFRKTYEARLLSHLVEKAAHAERVSDDLRQTQELLQAILDNSPAMVWVKNLDGRYLMVNEEFLKVNRVPSDEIIGETAAALFPPEDEEEFERNFRAVVDAGRAMEFEEIAHHKDGVRTWLSTKYPLKDSKGDIYAVCGISLDITQRKSLEDRLIRAQKMEGIGRLAGGIAHDFNNLLAVIINYATFAGEDLPESDRRADDLQQVIAAAKEGADLVRQLLTFSKGGTVAVETIDVNEVIQRAEGLLRGSLEGGISLVLDLVPEELPTRINRDQLGQVLLNLIVNARDAMPSGGTITIRTKAVEFARPFQTVEAELLPGEYVRLMVADTGTGIPEETLERIFDPFFTTKDETGGTGLGLSTVHGIVKGVDGSVTVESEPGVGTTFYVHLPLQREEAPAIEPATVPAAEPPETLEGTVEERNGILVVDEEEPIRALLERALVRQGYEVFLAPGGEEALTIYEQERDHIMLVITNIHMPGMKGEELAERLTAAAPGLPVIYMSGSEGRGQGRRRVGTTVAPFLPKPFTIVELLAKVQRALGDHRDRAGNG